MNTFQHVVIPDTKQSFELNVIFTVKMKREKNKLKRRRKKIQHFHNHRIQRQMIHLKYCARNITTYLILRL